MVLRVSCNSRYRFYIQSQCYLPLTNKALCSQSMSGHGCLIFSHTRNVSPSGTHSPSRVPGPRFFPDRDTHMENPSMIVSPSVNADLHPCGKWEAKEQVATPRALPRLRARHGSAAQGRLSPETGTPQSRANRAAIPPYTSHHITPHPTTPTLHQVERRAACTRYDWSLALRSVYQVMRAAGLGRRACSGRSGDQGSMHEEKLVFVTWQASRAPGLPSSRLVARHP
jgi:hypothetical protein